MNDRVNRIKQAVKKREEDELREKLNKQARIDTYIEEIKALAPRLDELMEVGEAFLEAGYSLFNTRARERQHGHFCTDGIYHAVGFLYNMSKNKILGFGKEGGGWADYNLEITPSPFGGYKISVSGDVEFVLKEFLLGFNDFEKDFYEYVDKMVGE